jgi:hypothetical protein
MFHDCSLRGWKEGISNSHQGWLNLVTREAGHWVPASSLTASGWPDKLVGTPTFQAHSQREGTAGVPTCTLLGLNPKPLHSSKKRTCNQWKSLSNLMYCLRGDVTLHLSCNWCNSWGVSFISISLVEVFRENGLEGSISHDTPLAMVEITFGTRIVLWDDLACWLTQRSCISWSVLGEWISSRRSMDLCESSFDSMTRSSWSSIFGIASFWISSSIAFIIWWTKLLHARG